VLLAPAVAVAGNVVGHVELPPPPERPPVVQKGFLDRVENPLANIRPVPVTPYIIVVLEGEAPINTNAAVEWGLVGESFSQPVVAVPKGAELVIKNQSKLARTLVAVEDPKLVPQGPINPTGPKSFRPTEAKVYTIADKDAKHLRGTLVVTNTSLIATVDATGKFELDAPPGNYKLRVFYRDAWTKVEEPVTVPPKGKAEVNVKGLVGAPQKK
jgi:hypothetical protein